MRVSKRPRARHHQRLCVSGRRSGYPAPDLIKQITHSVRWTESMGSGQCGIERAVEWTRIGSAGLMRRSIVK